MELLVLENLRLSVTEGRLVTPIPEQENMTRETNGVNGHRL
jgi:hypothetical protein